MSKSRNSNFSESTAGRKKILIVEDDESILESLVDELSDRGFKVHGLNSPNKIFEEIINYKPEVLLVDYYLPLKNGLEINKTLIERNQNKNMLFILMSAHRDIKEVAGDNGVMYLEKPFSVNELERLINIPPMSENNG
jgi:DNA-binding response OmpR family regulator